jgi:hypothetical protein
MRNRSTLAIYVLPECPGCERARWTAEQARHYCPGITVDLIDLSIIDSPPPDVFSAPTYVLDGRVISLGNPPLADLIRSLDSCIGDAHDRDD